MKEVVLKSEVRYWWECPSCKSGQDYKYNRESNIVICKDCGAKFRLHVQSEVYF